MKITFFMLFMIFCFGCQNHHIAIQHEPLLKSTEHQTQNQTQNQTQQIPIKWNFAELESLTLSQIISLILAPNVTDQSPCEEAIKSALKKDLIAIDIEKQRNDQKDNFSVLNQAPSLRGRVNVFGLNEQVDKNVNYGKLGLRVPVPVDVFVRQKQSEVKQEEIKVLYQQRALELKNLVMALHDLIQLKRKELLVQTLKIRTIQEEIKSKTIWIKQGNIPSIEAEMMLLDLGLEQDLLHQYQMEYEGLIDDWLFYTAQAHIGGYCQRNQEEINLASKLYLWKAEYIRLEIQSKESMGLFLEMGVQDQSMSNIGYLNFGLQLPWSDPQHENYTKLVVAQRESLKLRLEYEQKSRQRKIKQDHLNQRKSSIQKLIDQQKPLILFQEQHDYERKQKLIKYFGKYFALEIEYLKTLSD